jgi:hypothetical protein
LSRYRGPIREEAIGPYLANLRDIEILFQRVTSKKESGSEYPEESTWEFE